MGTEPPSPRWSDKGVCLVCGQRCRPTARGCCNRCTDMFSDDSRDEAEPDGEDE